MTNIPYDPNSKDQYNNRAYNYCSGKGCNNIPSHYLKLVLIKKSGFFCETCADYLKDNNLIESVLDEKVRYNKRSRMRFDGY